MKILLSGYYGFGNLGDDLLLITTYWIVKATFPEALFHVLSNSKTNDYIYELTDSKVIIKNYKTLDSHYDMIIHGGGGIHFDYTPGNWYYFLLNGIIKLTGVSISFHIIKYLNRFLGFKKISCNKRIGIGIGFGPYTPSSRKFFHDLTILKEYQCLFVRDRYSLAIAKKYFLVKETYESTDLCFLLNNLYSIRSHVRNQNDKQKNICVILRDWKYDDNIHVKNIINIINHLQSSYKFCYISFDENDEYFINCVNNPIIYNPSSNGLLKVIEIVKNQDLIITSRAHGAYLGCLFNIPSICINIESKLKNVHDSLPNSSLLMPSNITPEILKKSIESVFSNYGSYLNGSKIDLSLHQNKAKLLLEFFKNFKNEFR